MKGRSYTGDRRRIDLAAAFAAVLQVALLAGCGLDSSGIVLDGYRYNVSATIQSEDGRRSVVSSENLAVFSSPDDRTLFGGLGDSDEERVAGYFSAYLKSVLVARGSDPAFQDLYGIGPWCLVEARATATDVLVEDDDETYFSWDELPSCECGEVCGNDPPLAGVLSVAPTTPARPTVIDFGTVALGASVAREVELENVGDGFLCLNPPEVDDWSSEHPDDFTVTPISGCNPSPEEVRVDPGGICRFRATFTPQEPGPRSARVPTLRGCNAHVLLEGVGAGGRLTASPAPACFTPLDPGDTCAVVPIRIENIGTATVSLSSASLSGMQPGWELLRLSTGAGATINLAAGPHALAAGGIVVADVQACALATAEDRLRVTHNGRDYGAPGVPGELTGDVDSGSPLVVRLQPRSSGCTPTP